MQFSINRLWLLVRKQWAENRQFYILGLLAIAGIMAATIMYNFLEFAGFEQRVQENTFIVGLMAGGFVFTTTILSQLNQKITSINIIMLPASALEKLAMAAIYSMVLFPVCFLITVCPLIVLGQYIDHNIIGHPNSLYVIGANKKTFYILLTFLALQSTALFVSVLFKRYVLIKGIILVMVVFFGSLIINPFLARSIIKTDPDTPVTAAVKETYYDTKQNIVETNVSNELLWTKLRPDVPYSDLEINNWGVERNIKGISYTSHSASITNPYGGVFVVFLIMGFSFLWVITWFKLKEKEL